MKCYIWWHWVCEGINTLQQKEHRYIEQHVLYRESEVSIMYNIYSTFNLNIFLIRGESIHPNTSHRMNRSFRQVINKQIEPYLKFKQ